MNPSSHFRDRNMKCNWLGHFVVIVQLLSHVWLFATSWATAHQASLSSTIFRSLFKFMSIEGKAMAPHLSTLAWKIPWMEELGRLQSMGSLRARHTEQLHFDFSLSCIGEGNGNALQCSCLENRRTSAPGSAVSGVTQSRTRLKWLSSSSSKFL